MERKALTAITDDPPEWQDVTEQMGGQAVWQSRRTPSLFSRDGGKTYYDVNETPKWWRRLLTNHTSRRWDKTYKAVPHGR